MNKQNRIYQVIATLLLFCCFTGCATIFNGRTQRIRVDSNIPGAVVKIDDTIVGQTPFLGDMPRSKKSRTITVQPRGFDSQYQSMTVSKDVKTVLGNSLISIPPTIPGTVLLFSTYDAGYGALIILGAGLSFSISTTVDNKNGSAYQYTPSSFYFHFADEYGTNTDEIILRKYAMLNHSQIAIDAQDESGEYLNALADMMSKKMSRDEAIESIKVALEYSEGDQLAFGDEIVDSFRYHH